MEVIAKPRSLLIPIALIVAATSLSNAQAMSPSAFRKAANSICEGFVPQLNQVTLPSPLANYQQRLDFINAATPILDSAYSSLSTIKSPKRYRKNYKNFVGWLNASKNNLNEAKEQLGSNEYDAGISISDASAYLSLARVFAKKAKISKCKPQFGGT